MNYIDLDFDALYGEALALYRENGGDILFPGDEKEMLLRTVLGILQQERASLNAAIAQGTIRNAEGEYLDILGENAGIARQKQTDAEGTLEITVQRGTSGITIAEGTMFSCNGMLTFETTQAAGATAGAGQAVLTVPIRCTTGGAAGNGIEKGTPLSPVEPKAFYISCILTGTNERRHRAGRGGSIPQAHHRKHIPQKRDRKPRTVQSCRAGRQRSHIGRKPGRGRRIHCRNGKNLRADAGAGSGEPDVHRHGERRGQGANHPRRVARAERGRNQTADGHGYRRKRKARRLRSRFATAFRKATRARTCAPPYLTRRRHTSNGKARQSGGRLTHTG